MSYPTEEQTSQNKRAMLSLWLEFAVPVRILELRTEEWTPRELTEKARQAGALIAERADLLIREPTKPKHHEVRATLLSELATAVAIMARCPGGVTVFGKKFEVHPDG